MFGSLLDADRGGYYRIAPDRDDYVSRQLYLPDTAILVTRFMTPDGVGEVHDFMPVAGGTATDRHRLVWLFIHIGFLTGYRNRVGAVLGWWFAFTRDIRRERTFTIDDITLISPYGELPKSTMTNP